MKKYWKEIMIILIQLLIFYILPLFAGPGDEMGLVVLIILSTVILSIIMGILSNTKIKFIYPILVSLLFIPTVFVYYNESALIHSIWYFVISLVGLGIGLIIHLFIGKGELYD